MNDRDIVERNEKELVGLVKDGGPRRYHAPAVRRARARAGPLRRGPWACCSQPAATRRTAPAAEEMPPMDETKPDEITLYNWTDYMDPEIRRQFRQQEGIRVRETYFASNEELLAKLRGGRHGIRRHGPLRLHGLDPDQERPAAAARHGYLPNFEHIGEQFREPHYDDPSRTAAKFSVPYFYGTTGMPCAPTRRPEGRPPGSPSSTRPIAGRSTCWTTSGSASAPRSSRSDFSANTTDQGELDQATEKLIQQKPLVSTYDSVNMRRSIVQGVPYVMCWDGDVLLAIDTMGGDERPAERSTTCDPRRASCAGPTTW
jgi:spermidine/putrescine-binding protein